MKRTLLAAALLVTACVANANITLVGGDKTAFAVHDTPPVLADPPASNLKDPPPDSAGANTHSSSDPVVAVGLAAVPETDAYAILLAGLGIMAFVSGRRRRAD